MQRRICTLLLVCAMVLSSVSIALAAPFDLSHRTGTANYSFNQFVDSPSIFDEVADDMENFLIEAVDGSFYNVKDVNDRLEAGAADFAEAIEGLQPVQPGEEDDLEVVSVSAITQTIAAGKDVDLKFEVNGKEVTKAEFDETYGEEDYTVTFKYNRTDADLKATGEVNTDKDFKYAVQVKDAEGTLIPEELGLEDYLEVKVVDATKAVSIETVELKNNNDLNYLTVEATGVGFEVTSAKNALGEELEEADLTQLNNDLVKVVSSDLDVAYYAEGEIVARAAGTVTFTLTYGTGDDAIKVEVPVEVKEAGVATRVEVEDQKVAINTALTDLDFKVFDQHDLDITSTNKYSVVVKDEGVTDLSAKGTYTVEILNKKAKAEVIGTFAVTVVDIAEAKYDSFLFEEVKGEDGKDVVLDVKVGNPVKTKELKLYGIIDGVKVLAADLADGEDPKIVTSGDGLYLESSDKDVFTVAYNEGTVIVTLAGGLDKAATAKVVLTNKMGSIEIVEAELELEVVNTTPQIDKLTLGDEDKVVVGDTEKATLVAALEVLLTDGKADDAEDKFAYVMVEDIMFIPGNNIVEVKIKDIYGGKVFRFDVEVIDGTVVRTQEQLIAALENANVETIVLGADINLTETVELNKDLNGNNKNLRGKIKIMADDVTIDDVTIDGGGNGSTVKINGKNAKITNSTLKNAGKTTWDAVIDVRTSGDVTVEGCDISEGFRAILVYDAKKVMVDNCLLDGVYPINVNSTNENIELIVSNSTLNGWTSYGEIKSATFTNVNFGKETLYNQYAFIRPYADTTFTNCNFSNEIEFSSGKAGIKVDFINSKINDVKLTEAMLKEKFEAEDSVIIEEIKNSTWMIDDVEISFE